MQVPIFLHCPMLTKEIRAEKLLFLSAAAPASRIHTARAVPPEPAIRQTRQQTNGKQNSKRTANENSERTADGQWIGGGQMCSRADALVGRYVVLRVGMRCSR
ncbi:hypothetical protein HOY80DRAFT_1021584 [Tuber brumale]|nr:hypothetical protein HOY80DRAFT_1021584 [Tuber brumale]